MRFQCKFIFNQIKLGLFRQVIKRKFYSRLFEDDVEVATVEEAIDYPVDGEDSLQSVVIGLSVALGIIILCLIAVIGLVNRNKSGILQRFKPIKLLFNVPIIFKVEKTFPERESDGFIHPGGSCYCHKDK